MLVPPGRGAMEASEVGSKILCRLEEVVWRTSADHRLAGSWAWIELQAADNGQ